MRTALVTASVLGLILMAGTSARSDQASAQSRGHADFQGYWMGVDPVDGGDARRSLILRSDGKYALAARDSMLHALRQHRSRLCQLRRRHGRQSNCDAVEHAHHQVLQQRRDGPVAPQVRAG